MVCVVGWRRVLRVEMILVPLALPLGWLLGLEELDWCFAAVQGPCIWEVMNVLFLGQVALEIYVSSVNPAVLEVSVWYLISNIFISILIS